MGASSPEKFAIGEALGRYGHSSDKTPPYEKRPNGTELWCAAVKKCYRSASATERREKGTSSITLGRTNSTTEREAEGYISHAVDFAVAVADRNYDFLSMVDVDLVTALKKLDVRNGAM